MSRLSIKQVLHTPVRYMALAIAVAFGSISASSQAALPGTIKPGHPRLFTSSTQLQTLKSQLPIAPANLTPDGGSISFELKPQRRVTGDGVNAGIFSDYNSTKNTIFVRHVDQYDTDTSTVTRLQIALQQGAQYVAVTGVDVPFNQWTSITVNWDSAARTASVKVNGVTTPLSWRADAGNWTANSQQFGFTPRKNDEIRNFTMLDKSRVEIKHFDTLDLPLARAWTSFLSVANSAKATLAACGNNPVDPNVGTICNVATGHRIQITDAAQQLALAYRMTGDTTYLDAALIFINRMLSVAPATGTEWTQGGRVGAMAILYDWLYAELGNVAVPNDGRSYRTVMAQSIKGTIAAVSSKPSDDLNNSICGPQLLKNTSSEFDCAQPPVYANWNRYARPLPASISQYYITGHNFSAVNEIALGLLAIADEYPETQGMLNTAWNHFEQGFMVARSQISVDGGHHTGYAYGVAAMPERVLMWRNALTGPGTDSLFAADWQNKLIYPYIYGLRSDNSYPARGDDFGKVVGEYDIGYLALWAASGANDGTAASFYKNTILPARSGNFQMILERLYWPVTTQETSVDTLPLSRHFRVAGSVVMRDSWDFKNATLVDFKSSNLASENHQHLDQNSFSLFYKAPLLLDSGLYDEYGSFHWNNYFTRSIAHNTITVYDASEHFVKNGKEFTNDGGQWYPSVLYPTLEEIQPGASNYLDGVSKYEYGNNWTFVTGNASKAYNANKLDQANGFLRSMVFLRAPGFWQKPVTVVFDTVRTKNSLPASFILHPAGNPVADVTAVSASAGVYDLPFAAGSQRVFTIRNGGGMLTAQTILPANAKVQKIGGSGGANCSQIDPASGLPKSSTAPDCRFLVRDNNLAWRNYPIKYVSGSTTVTPQGPYVSPEIGDWRLEISPATAVPANSTQTFLHVLSVADNDGASNTAAKPDAKTLPSDASTVALLLGNSTLLSFNSTTQAASSQNWLAPAQNLSLLLSGLKANADFIISVVPEGSGYRYTVQETVGGPYHSSDQGILSTSL